MGLDYNIANIFNGYFINKIVVIRENITKSATVSTVTEIKEKMFPMFNLEKLSCFSQTAQNKVKRLVVNSSSVTCDNDPLPTYLVNQHIDMLAHQITRVINKSLEAGCVPDDLKHANIISLMTRDNLDKDILRNYRSVSNLTFLSKLLKKVVAERL